MAIYLKLDEKPKTVEELLTKFFSYVHPHSWVGIILSTTTYENPECTIIDCREGKYRSADDIVDLVKTYFPRTREKTIFKKLLKLRIKNGDYTYRVKLYACTDIRKPTVCFSKLTSHISSLGFVSEDMSNSRYKDWAEICKTIGINSKEELSQYN